jgi:hypothetical protein
MGQGRGIEAGDSPVGRVPVRAQAARRVAGGPKDGWLSGGSRESDGGCKYQSQSLHSHIVPDRWKAGAGPSRKYRRRRNRRMP